MLRILVRLSLALTLMSILVACGSTSTTPATSQSFTVAAKEFGFTPNQLTVKAGQAVELSFQNMGAVEHDWSVREIDLTGTPRAAEESGGGHMMGDMHDMPKLHVAAGPGAQGKLTFVPSKPGAYGFYCSVTGHKEAGMVGTLAVTAA